MVKSMTLNQRVLGSSPSASTIFSMTYADLLLKASSRVRLVYVPLSLLLRATFFSPAAGIFAVCQKKSLIGYTILTLRRPQTSAYHPTFFR